jgi:hypothetical protein
MSVSNVFACLVHERPECVIDLVRNLHYLDPTSVILLYNGSTDPGLIDRRFPFERYGVVTCPGLRKVSWGRLHEFALDCMQFALDTLRFDTLTIVDSDQLLVRPGYSNYVARALDNGDRVGLLGNSAAPHPPGTPKHAPRSAHAELELWRPFLRRFPNGEQQFPHWTYWPSTVITADAARDLTRLFATDDQLQEIMRHTRILVTEEVILPTLVALMGYTVKTNPCSYDFVKFRARYTLEDLEAALSRPDVFWIHPVQRLYDDELRAHIRTTFNDYDDAKSRPPAESSAREPD